MSGLHLRRISAAIMFLTISPMIASAQSGTSMIRGQALDRQSRAVPRARITVIEENKRLVRTETTGDLGEFAFVGLPPTALVGASLIAGAHILNHRYSRGCGCCETVSEMQAEEAVSKRPEPEITG